MKICLLTYRGNPYSGGQGVYVTALGRELARQGHDVHCITGPPYPPPEEGITWHRLPGMALELTRDNDSAENDSAGGDRPFGTISAALSPLALMERGALAMGMFPEIAAFSLRAFYCVRKLLSRHRFDVIHDNQTLGWGLLPMKALGIPMVATIHHPLTIDRRRGFDPPTSFRRQLGQTLFYPIGMQGFVARRMPRIVTVSHASARAIRHDFRVRPERLIVIYNGIDGDHFRPPAAPSRVAGRAIWVGNLEDRNKGAAYLLQSVPHCRNLRELLVITASPRIPEWATSLVRDLGVTDRVRFHEPVDRAALPRWFATADLAVCSSIFEGFGMPIAEAMACGLPVVAARGGALPEVVGDAGLLVPPRDPVALAAAIDKLLGDPPLRRRLGRAARKRVLARFRWEDTAKRVVEVYRGLRGL